MFKLPRFFDMLYPVTLVAGFADEGEGAGGGSGEDGTKPGEGDGGESKPPAGEGSEGADGSPAGQGDDHVEPDDADKTDYDALVLERGAKNVISEIKRKAAKEQAKLQKELDEARKPKVSPAPEGGARPPAAGGVKSVLDALSSVPRGKKAIEHLKSLNLKDEDIEAIVNLNELVAEAKARQATSGLDKYKVNMARESMKGTLTTIGEDPKFKFIVSKYGGELEAFLKKEKVSPEHWDDESTIKIALKSLWFDKQGDGNTPGKPEGDAEQVAEGRPAGGSGGSGGVAKEELEDYAAKHGLVLNQSTYATIKAGYLARIKAQKAREEQK